MPIRIDSVLLVQYLTMLATQRSAALTPLRLVKFLYLADLYYARENDGRTLTGWPWAFVHYGPYCAEAMEAIEASEKRGLITALPYESKYDGEEHRVYRWSGEGESSLEDELPIYVSSPLKGAIRRWADDSARLLDHVYFETEPMLTAKPRQRLDFGLARRAAVEKPIEMLRLSKDKLQAARVLVGELAHKYQEQAGIREAEAERELRDDEYGKTLQLLSDEPLEEGFTGEAAIQGDPKDESH